jgi:hypothetical protein
MATVSVTIALATKPEVLCDVSVERDSDGQRTWQRFGWLLGGLDLLTNSGQWVRQNTSSRLASESSHLPDRVNAAGAPQSGLGPTISHR